MSRLFLVLLSITSFLSFTQAQGESIEEAHALFADRWHSEEGIQSAAASAAMYERLAKNEADLIKKSELSFRAARAHYYSAYNGNALLSKSEKLAHFRAGSTIGHNIYKLLEENDTGEGHNSRLAQASFWYATHLARVMELEYNIAYKETVLEYAERARTLDPTVVNYGPDRMLGRVYHRLPTLAGGSKKKARSYLTTAYIKTYDRDIKLSRYSGIVYFYLDVLQDLRDKKTARRICSSVEKQTPESMDIAESDEYNLPEIAYDWELIQGICKKM